MDMRTPVAVLFLALAVHTFVSCLFQSEYITRTLSLIVAQKG